MIERVKLKHLPLLEQDIKHSEIMKEVLGFKKKRFLVRRFFRAFRQADKLVRELNQLNIEDLEYKEGRIKKPVSVDHIPFIGRMELESLFESDFPHHMHVATTIAIVCSKEHMKGGFDSSTNRFDWFRKEILNEPLTDMLALYKKIEGELRDSNKFWGDKFQEVESIDPDMIMAGGQMLSRFNVIELISKSCEAFNVEEKDAWQLSYLKVMSKSLSDATRGKVQEQLSKIKQKKMEAKSR